ncbi:MAG: tyrosine-type recombinase/integrase [Acidimicrobiales bacterium]
MTLGTYESRQHALDAIAHARSGGLHGRFIDPTRGRTRFVVIAEQWWLTRTGHRVSTRARDRIVLDRHLLSELRDAQLIELTHEEVQAWVNRLAVRVAPATVQRCFTVLRQVLNYAVDNRVLALNPSERIVLPRREWFEARFLTPDELELLAATVDVRSRAMVLVMAWATLRIGEALGLRRIDLDLMSGRLRVANNLVEIGGQLHEGPPKTKAGRRSITLPSSVVADLRLHVARFGSESHLFTTPNGLRWRAEDWRTRVWRPAVERTGLAPLRPHDLKHTGVALLAAAGVDPSEIARRAGHTSVSFTYDRYGHLFPEIDHAAAAKLDAIRSGGLRTVGDGTTASHG